MSKSPPIPPDQQNAHHSASPASRDAEVSRDPAGGNAQRNIRQQGQEANTFQNTTPVRKVQGR